MTMSSGEHMSYIFGRQCFCAAHTRGLLGISLKQLRCQKLCSPIFDINYDFN